MTNPQPLSTEDCDVVALESPIEFGSSDKFTGDRQKDGVFDNCGRRVLILYISGTIGMTHTESGALKPCKGYLTRVVRQMGETQNWSEIPPFDILEYDELLDSSDMCGSDYLRVAMSVERHYNDYDGFLVLHGTDTMHYTASALSFLLKNLAKPVVLTGSMVPLAEPHSDARQNLVMGLILSSNPAISEVCIFFNGSLLRGNCCTKLYHTFGAISSPNWPALGVMKASGFHLRKHLLLPPPPPPPPDRPLREESTMNGRVMAFVLHPGCDMMTLVNLLLREDEVVDTDEEEEEEENAVAKTSRDSVNHEAAAGSMGTKTKAGGVTEGVKSRTPVVDAVLLEIHGVGAVDTCYAKALQHLAHVAESRGVVMCAITREPSGGLLPVEQQRLNSIAPYIVYLHMTDAAAEAKLMYLFGRGLSPGAVREMMPLNFSGEITSGMEAGFDEGILSCRSLQQELRAVTGERTRLSLQVEQLQCEVKRLRASQRGSTVDANMAPHRHTRLQGANSELRTNVLLFPKNERREKMLQHVNETKTSPTLRSDCCIDSVRLPIPELLSAVRATLNPGTIPLDDGSSATIEYADDYVVVRGSRPSCGAFMKLLLNTVLKHVEGGTHGRPNDAHHVSPAAGEVNALAICSKEVKKGRVRLGASVLPEVSFSVEDDEDDDDDEKEKMIHKLRQALEMGRVECERVQMARDEAENESALKEATLNAERARHMQVMQGLEERVRQLELDLGKKTESLQTALHRLGKMEREQEVAGEEEATMVILQRETELLREEKERMSNQLKRGSSMAKQQHNRLCRMESAVAHLCRNVLNTSEIAAAAAPAEEGGGKGGYGTGVSLLLLHRRDGFHGDVDMQRVRTLVDSLSAKVKNEATVEEGALMEGWLADLEALLDMERRAWRATLEFALHERDAALQAQREETLLLRRCCKGAAGVTLLPGGDKGGATAEPTSQKDWRVGATAVAAQEENVALRIELHRCLEEMRQIGDAVARSQALQQEMQGKLRACERRVGERDEMILRIERKHACELMTARERERSLELQLQRQLQEQRQQQKQKQQRDWVGEVHTLDDAGVVQQSPHDMTLHLVQTPVRSSRCVRNATTPMTGTLSARKEKLNETIHAADRIDHPLAASVSGPTPGLGGPMMMAKRSKKQGANGAFSSPPFSSSTLTGALRKENFEGALDAICSHQK